MVDSNLEAIQKRYEDWLLELPNVVSVGIGERSGTPVIQVGVTHKVPRSDLKPEELIPNTLDGADVDVIEIGEVAIETWP